jgi:DNA primase
MNILEIKQKVKEELKIEDVISEYVQLTKSGKNYKGLCPFHEENTPSFFVFPKTQTFKCFGCGEQGDIISFIEKHEHIDFKEAIAILSSKLGIKIEDNSEPYSNLLYKLKELYKETLKNLPSEHPAKVYISSRLTDNEIDAYDIGFSSGQEYETLYAQNIDLFNELGYSNTDMFLNRIIFPIKNDSGAVIGFGGRSIDDNNQPKYLNSPASKIFNKSTILYGIDKAKKVIESNNFVILCEGYMDTIKLQSCGLQNTVGILGVNFTDDLINKINKLNKNQILMFDNDKTGMKAKIKYIKNNMIANITVTIYKGKDPDEFIKNVSRAQLIDTIKKSVTAIDFLLVVLRKTYNLENEFQKNNYLKELSTLYKDAIAKGNYQAADKILKEIERLNISKEVFLGYDNNVSQKENINKINKRRELNITFENKLSNIEITLLTLIIRKNDEITAYLKQLDPDVLPTELSKRILINFQKNERLDVVAEEPEIDLFLSANNYKKILEIESKIIAISFEKFKNVCEKSKIKKDIKSAQTEEEKALLLEKLIQVQKGAKHWKKKIQSNMD